MSLNDLMLKRGKSQYSSYLLRFHNNTQFHKIYQNEIFSKSINVLIAKHISALSYLQTEEIHAPFCRPIGWENPRHLSSSPLLPTRGTWQLFPNLLGDGSTAP
jgi:hypothetical protein